MKTPSQKKQCKDCGKLTEKCFTFDSEETPESQYYCQNCTIKSLIVQQANFMKTINDIENAIQTIQDKIEDI